jgi:hypothetical protein
MNIIDQYIADHYYDPLSDLAFELGISIGYVAKRRIRLKPNPTPAPKVWVDNERLALVQLIQERQTGWAVDVAKERLKKLQNRE